MDAFLSKLEANRMEDMVGKHRNEEVAIGAPLNVMAYRSEAQFRFHTPEGVLYIPDGVVKIP